MSEKTPGREAIETLEDYLRRDEAPSDDVEGLVRYALENLEAQEKLLSVATQERDEARADLSRALTVSVRRATPRPFHDV